MSIIIFANGVIAQPAELAARYARPGDLILAANGGTRHALAAGRPPHHVIGDLDSFPADLRARLESQGTTFHPHPPAKDATDLELALLWAAKSELGVKSEELGVAGSGSADQRISPQSSVLSPQSSVLSPQSSVLSPQSSVLSPQSSVLSPQSSVLSPQSSALSPQPSVLNPQSSALSPQIVILGALGGRPDQALANLLLLALPQLAGLDVVIADAGWQIRCLRGGETLRLRGRPGDTLSLIPLGGSAAGVTTTGLAYPLRGETLLCGPARGVSNALVGESATIALTAGLLWCFHRMLAE